MRTFLLISIFILLVPQIQKAQIVNEDSSILVLSSKWLKYRQKIEKPNNQITTNPQAAMTNANRNFERTRRVNDPVGAPDPNEGTLDTRSAALEKNVQESRSSKSGLVDGFMYQVKIRNASANTIEVLFWEYQFNERSNPTNVVSRHFLCGVNIKPNKVQELRGFSTLSPSNLINVNSSAEQSSNLIDEKILINRVEYADGTIWQRKDWSYVNMKPSIARALETPWGTEMCRSL